MLTDLHEEELHASTERLRSQGRKAECLVLDVTEPQACIDAAERLQRETGGIDILIANAGIAWVDTAAEDLSDHAWKTVLDVNLNGAFWTCRAFGAPMLSRGRGSIVTVGSMSGTIANKPQRQAHYNASKAAVHHLTRSLAGEWAERGVRVNGVAPAYVNTVMSNTTAKRPEYFDVWMEGTPMRRMIDPEEVASAILFLASDAASGITGAIVAVDGGYTVW